MITVLSGGVGAARLLRALSGFVDPSAITAVVNVGDDLTLHGLAICPDLDTITYTLAGLDNEELGWGRRGESWRVMDELDALGGESWFRLGDLDLATHLYRTQRLADGATKTEVASELSARHGVAVRLLPVSDDPVATILHTGEGPLTFQEYFVRRRHDVAVTAVEFEGIARARATAAVVDALASADRVVIAPSNPFLSIDPVLAVAPVRELLAARSDDVVAVSPIVGGRALKGPAERLLRELGHAPTALGVVEHYGDLVGTWVVDEADRDLAPAIAARGHEVIVTTTVMDDPKRSARLAAAVVG